MRERAPLSIIDYRLRQGRVTSFFSVVSIVRFFLSGALVVRGILTIDRSILQLDAFGISRESSSFRSFRFNGTALAAEYADACTYTRARVRASGDRRGADAPQSFPSR